MQTLHKALLLKKIYMLKDYGFEYVEPNLIKPINSCFKIKDSHSLGLTISSCTLCKNKNSVPHTGLVNLDSKVAFISLFPILDTGNRFVSKSSDMLLKIIKLVLNLEISNVSILPLIKCQTNRANEEKAFNNCKDFLFKQLEFAKPKIVVCLGEEVYKYMFDGGLNYKDIQGRFIKWNNYDIFPTFSISNLLRQPQLKTIAHKEFLTLKGNL